ncbi:MAG TPA: 50S ribosomal protein L11 methyltransferase [Vicinamibacterales bacterium]|nr:50S ribosomal protein L11 methyltransferase [Vicinamibacterales bacterium]
MPYRIDIPEAGVDTFDRLVELGALDVESDNGAIAALMPDAVAPEQVVEALGLGAATVSPAAGRDADSVWVLSLRSIRIGGIELAPADAGEKTGRLRLIDSAAFGTGLHPTTALCLEALAAAVQPVLPEAVLDVGTGSGVLALAALMLGVPRALAIDIDDQALRVAAENARLNGLDERFQAVRGGPETVAGTWPLVLANVLAAPLVEMAPALVRCVGHHGQLVLSGVPSSLEADVAQAYRHLGMRFLRRNTRAGWVVLVLQAPW